jgi:hypothetical protein
MRSIVAFLIAMMCSILIYITVVFFIQVGVYLVSNFPIHCMWGLVLITTLVLYKYVRAAL